SVGDLANKLIGLAGSSAKVVSEDVRKRPKKSEVERLLGCNEKIKKLTAWKPQVNIEDGLKKTAEWFNNKENIKNYKSDIYNV
ncbi:MAG: NAD-dependent dehydratase, partial [Elusimicrobia bacterium]|nr:NAD-dependent dehydratase [Elusimicrobiota bacterium]